MKKTFAPWADSGADAAITVRSTDGRVMVSMQRTQGGIFVQRTLQRHGTARVVQASRIGSAEDFRRWCDADAARFDDPLFIAKLVRDADRLFIDHATSPVSG